MDRDAQELESLLRADATDEGIVGRDGHLREHVRCRACGYDVYGLGIGEQCPECGAPVSLAAHGDGLEFYPPRRLRAMGLWIRVSALVLGVLPVAVLLAMYSWGFVLLPLIVLGLWSVAALAAVQAEPTDAVKTRWRRAVRLCGGLAIGSGMVPAVCWALYVGRVYYIGPGQWLAVCIGIMVVAALVGFVCYGHWLGRLMLRVPSPTMVLPLQQRPWIVILLGIVLFPGGISTSRDGTSALTQLGCGGVFLVWWACTWMLAYSWNIAGEMVLMGARMARQNEIIHAAQLRKEQRFYRASETQVRKA